MKKRTLEAALENMAGIADGAPPVAVVPASLPNTPQYSKFFLDNSPEPPIYTAEPEPLTLQPPNMDGTDALQETLRAVKILEEGGDGDVASTERNSLQQPQPSSLSNGQSNNAVPSELAVTPQEFQRLSDLARSITNVAYQLGTFSQNEEALQLYREATDIRRRLAAQGDEVQLSELSQSLHNLAHHLRIMGRDAEGLSLDSEVVVIRRGLVARNPDVYLPSLAAGLHMLGHVYSCVLREQEALPFFQEVVEIYRKLVAENPDSYKSDLAQSLHNLAHHLRKLGRNEEGLRLDIESLELRRQVYSS